MYRLDINTHFEKVLDVLSYSPLFFDFSFDELAEMIKTLELIVYEDGEALTIEGEPPQGFFVLIDGRVMISTGPIEGNHLDVIELEPPEIIGEVSLILNTNSSANTQAQGTVLAMRFSRKNFHDLMRENPQFSLSICRILVSRLYRLTQQIAQLRADPSADIRETTLKLAFAPATGLAVYKTAKMLLAQPDTEAFQSYDLAQSLDIKSARDLWFGGDGKVYRTAIDAIIINLMAQVTHAKVSQRGALGLIEAFTDQGQRLTLADYLWPKHPHLCPHYRLQNRPMAPLTIQDDVYKRINLALIDTLAADTFAVLERLGNLPAGESLRTISDLYELTNDFGVKFMNFSRLNPVKHTPIEQSDLLAMEGKNNAAIAIFAGIETAVRIMVRLVRLMFDKFETVVQRLPTTAEIQTILIPNLRQSHQILTMLARVNLIDLNTRNLVLTGRTGQWYDPDLFIYKSSARTDALPWDGDLTTLHEYGLYPSPTVWQQFQEVAPSKAMLRAVGGHTRTDGCPARAPLTLSAEAQQLGLCPEGAPATAQEGKEVANALLIIFQRVVVHLAPFVYEMDRQQRFAQAETLRANQQRAAEQRQRDAERKQLVEELQQEIFKQHPGLSKKELSRMVAARLKEREN